MAIAGALWRFWYLHGHFSEGRRWLQGTLAREQDPGDVSGRANRARALYGGGVLAMIQDDNAQALILLEESLALYRGLELRQGVATALNGLGNLAFQQGDHTRAAALHGEALLVRRELGDSHGIATSLGNLATIARTRGDYGGAARLLEESLALRRQIGDAQGAVVAISNLAHIAWEQGDLTRAEALCRESLATSRQLGDRQGVASALGDLAALLLEAGTGQVAAVPSFQESLALYEALGNRWGVASCLEGLAWACMGTQARRAVRLLAAAAAIRQEIAAPPRPHLGAIRDRNIVTLRSDLGDAVFDAEWEVGMVMVPQRVSEEAFDADLDGSRTAAQIGQGAIASTEWVVK